ncbi:hypothetical protein, partial [Streptococcus pneumoniae]|uniref:hypothetical protein n=1 Tax=Streptococcus pneumoniae TaxID=1313 RepID=UPI001954F1EA
AGGRRRLACRLRQAAQKAGSERFYDLSEHQGFQGRHLKQMSRQGVEKQKILYAWLLVRGLLRCHHD